MIYRHTDTKVQQEFEAIYSQLKSLQNNTLSPGTIQIFTVPVPLDSATKEILPDGWVLCNGQEYSISVYPELYRAIGFLFESSTFQTFRVPNIAAITTSPASTNVVYAIRSK